MTTYPAAEGVPVKGAVIICAGGAFQFRSDENEGSPVALELSRRGYQCFVLDYRLRPYTQEEVALDLARAVRFVRRHADEYGIDEKDIAVMGFSAGGILAGEYVERLVLENWGHGFGSRGNWMDDYDKFLTKIFKNN